MSDATCDASYDKVDKVIHFTLLVSNVMYLIAGILGVMYLSGYYKIIGAFIIGMAITSYLKHTNERIGYASSSILAVLDTVSANSLCVLAIGSALIWSRKHKMPRRLALLTFIMATLAIATFILSRKGTGVGTWDGSDPDKSWTGRPTLTTGAAAPSDLPVREAQVQYGLYHSIWHMLSGFTAIIWVLLISS